jgi:hypothetical protein
MVPPGEACKTGSVIAMKTTNVAKSARISQPLAQEWNSPEIFVSMSTS